MILLPSPDSFSLLPEFSSLSPLSKANTPHPYEINLAQEVSSDLSCVLRPVLNPGNIYPTIS